MLCSPIVTPHQPTAVNGGNTTTSGINNTNGNSNTTSASSRTTAPTINGTASAAKMAHQRNHIGFMTTTTSPANGIASTKSGRNSTSTINISITNNNNSVRQQNFETSMTHAAAAAAVTTTTSENLRKSGGGGASNEPDGSITTTIREIKSRNIGLLSPLCQSTAANLNHHSNGITTNSAISSASTNANSNSSNIIIERRQAISMERLNSIQHTTTSPTSRYLSQIQSNHRLNRSPAASQSSYLISKENNSGSLSSGSNSSIDESASDAEQPDQFNLDNNHHHHQPHPHNNHHQNHHHLHHNLQKRLLNHSSSCVLEHDNRSSGLSRSASRVSRFKSAKEFFERLSTGGHHQQTNGFHQSPQQQQQHQQQPQQQQQQQLKTITFKPIKRSPERQQVQANNYPQLQQQQQQHQRGKVASRYIEPLAASLSHLATPPPPSAKQFNNLHSSSPITSNPHSLHSSSPAINLQPIGNNNTNTSTITTSISRASATPTPPRQSPIKTTSATASNASSLTEDSTITSSISESITSQCSDSIKVPVVPTTTTTTTTTTTSSTKLPAANSVVVAVVPLPRSLSLSSSSSTPVAPSVGGHTDRQHTSITPSPLPPRSLSLSLPFNSSSSSSSSAYVKLKTTDHSGLSTNTILHINNGGKSVINGTNCGQPVAEVAALAFRGDNVIVGNGSLLVRRNKQLRIKFDENTAATFEYPSEDAMIDELVNSNSSGSTSSTPWTAESESSETEQSVACRPELASAQADSMAPVEPTTAVPPALQSTANGLLPNQRLMWRQSFGLLLSNKSLVGGDSVEIERSNNNMDVNMSKAKATDSSSCLSSETQEGVQVAEVKVEEEKDDRWKGEW